MMNKKKITLWIILDLLLLFVVVGEAVLLTGRSRKAEVKAEQAESTVVQESSIRKVETTEESAESESEETAEEVTPVFTETPTPTAEAEEIKTVTRADVQQQVEQTILDCAGIWEVYIADEDGNVLVTQSPGENMTAGQVEYLYMADQIYHDVQAGVLESGSAATADILLQNRDSQSYQNLLDLFYNSGVIWDDETGRMKPNISGESYLYTFWDTGDGTTCYTCAEDSVQLLANIVNEAAQNDTYAAKELEILKQGWGDGKVSTSLAGREGADVTELASERENTLEDFAAVTLENGTAYRVGFMVKDFSDAEQVKNGIQTISSLAASYYATDHPEEPSGLEALKETLQTQIAGYSETVSVYVKDLNSEDSLEIIGGSDQKAASLIKLYVMASVYDQIQKGTLQETEEIDTLLTNMITVSDNESTNELVRRLSPDGTNWEEGSKVTNQYITEHGYTGTSMGRDVRDYRETPAEGENYTTVTDCGKILEEIYRGTCVSPEASEAMLNLLKQQTRRWKIPEGISSAEYIANKTGELDDTENDVAIVKLSDDKAYILCVMTSNGDSSTAISDIVQISSTVYQYFAS